MTLSTVWVYAESAEGKPTSLTLELLTKARELGGNVEAFYAGADAAGIAAALGEHGASKVYATGDLNGSLPGPAVAAAMATQIASGAPDLIMFGMTYEARDVMGRLSVKVDKPVLTNSIDVSVDGSTVKCTTAIFGGNTLVTTASRRWRAGIGGVPSEVVRRRARGWGGRRGRRRRGARHGEDGRGTRHRSPRRGVDGSEARRGQHRRVGRPWSR